MGYFFNQGYGSYLFSIFAYFFFHSNIFQAQKAKDKEENENLVEELDKDFTSLVQSEALLSLTEPNKMNALKALVNKSISNDQSNKDHMSATRTMDNSVQVLFIHAGSSWPDNFILL